MLGREARVSRTGQGRDGKNAIAIPKGCITIIDELGRPLKSFTVSIAINDKPAHNMTTDGFGRIYPLVHEIDEVKLQANDAHESGRGDSLITDSGHHFEQGGDAPAADA